MKPEDGRLSQQHILLWKVVVSKQGLKTGDRKIGYFEAGPVNN